MEDDKDTYTVDEALINLGFGCYQVFIFFYAGMGWISEAMEMMLLSFIGPAVQSAWGLSSHEESLITSIVFAGMLVGAYSGGIISDIYGRRKGFLIAATITAGAGFSSAFAPNFILLVIFRGMVGVGLGGGPVLSSWFLEFIPPPNRGTWMVVFSAFWTLGTIFEASIAWFIMPKLGWRWLLGVSALPSLALLIFYRMTPESPRYLCMRGRRSDALAILEKIARVNGRNLPSGVLVLDNCIELEEKLNVSEEMKSISPEENDSVSPNGTGSAEKLDVSDEAQLISPEHSYSVASPNGTHSHKNGVSLLAMLLSPELVRSTLLLWMVFFGNAFSYYGLVLLTTELNNPNNRCIHKQLQSSSQQDISYKHVFIASFAELPGLLISAAIVDTLGRKVSMASMFFVCFIFLLPLVFHLPQSITTGLLFGARICISGTFTIVYIYAPEIYPTSIRTTGVGVASSVGRIGGMVCPLVAVGLIHGCHQTVAIFLFESIVFVSGLCVWLFPLETKGLQLSNSLFSFERATNFV